MNKYHKKLIKKNRTVITVFLFVLLALLFIFFFPGKETFDVIRKQVAAIFFSESITVDQLHNKYQGARFGNGKIKILIVPGHNNLQWGTDYDGVKEADMNANLGVYLQDYLAENPEFYVMLARDRQGFNPVLQTYFDDHKDDIMNFVASQKKTMTELVAEGSFHSVEGVYHNSAPDLTVLQLYGINKWASDNHYDIVIHIHFNDYSGRREDRVKKYSGFVVYIPESQYSNAKASRAVAEPIFAQLSKYYATSNLPKENNGMAEDQDLIAIGSYNTLDPVGMLIEYGYIYESQFRTPEIRDRVLKDLAFQTSLGVNKFFAPNLPEPKFDTALLPHIWNGYAQKGVRSISTLSLQAALAESNVFPPAGEEKRDCPRDGKFNSCTEEALKTFQEKYGIDPTGNVGHETKRRLNEMFGN